MELRFAYYILYQADDLARRHAHAREGHLDGGVAALQKCGEEHLLDPPKDVRLPDPDERDARQVQQTPLAVIPTKLVRYDLLSPSPAPKWGFRKNTRRGWVRAFTAPLRCLSEVFRSGVEPRDRLRGTGTAIRLDSNVYTRTVALLPCNGLCLR